MLWYLINPMIIVLTTGGAFIAAFKSGRGINVVVAITVGLLLGVAGAYIYDWIGGILNSRIEKVKSEVRQDVCWAIYWISAFPWIGVTSFTAFSACNLLFSLWKSSH